MPRNVRNFWIEGYVDGRTTTIAAGPRARDGGFELRIHMRNDGMVERDILTVWGTAAEDGTLRLHAGFRGREAETYTTHRDKPIHEGEGEVMHATDIIAYTYDADYHCIGCTEREHPGSTDWRREGFDPADYTDSEGNEVHPVFASDEWWEPSNPECQVLGCGSCLNPIDNLHREGCEEGWGDDPCTLPAHALA